MADEDEEKAEDISRRDFLGEVTSVVVGLGLAASCVPFIESMSPSEDVLSAATTEVDLKPIDPGATKTVPWQGKPIFVMHRTNEQIKAMQASMGGFDPVADAKRVERPQWLVVIGICTHLGCVPNKVDEGWLCPCHGSLYDNSGRVLRGPAPKNLYLPPYHFVSGDTLLIGKDEKQT
ncbi:MAG: ubiquinol-cytochrome c reductase iron-sulfur subunit [Gammaproteobacteria bacterium]|nr:ubiquinol-cytochrome c reductase iron-sulfur subunit [Gammaproteobacteria bacterium]